jgi:flagellar L-ring protein precursor FlgH
MKTKSAYISKSVLVASVALVSAAPASAGSLWKTAHARETAMYTDRKARRIGDIITVVVSESASVSASKRTKTDKTASVDAAVDAFFWDPAASNGGTHNGSLPQTKMGGTTEFEGGGEISNRQTISARAAVTVVDVLPNGNLVIEGSRFVSYSGEKQYATLRGIVRLDDITNTNTVASSSIADARVEFLSEGTISASQRKGWLSRVIDTVNPF